MTRVSVRAIQTEARNAAMRALLSEGFPAGSQAAIGHGMSFHTWKSLCRTERLSNVNAVEMMVALVEITAR